MLTHVGGVHSFHSAILLLLADILIVCSSFLLYTGLLWIFLYIFVGALVQKYISRIAGTQGVHLQLY